MSKTGNPLRELLELPRWQIAVVIALALLLFCGAIHVPQGSQADQHSNYSSQEVASQEETSDDRIADYTWGLELFTAVLAIVGCFQMYFVLRADQTARKSIDLAREEFIATHRPKVIVRFIHLDLSEGPPRIRLTLANVGSSDATIISIKAGIGIKGTDNLAWLRPSPEPQEIPIPDPILVSGQRSSVPLALDGRRLGTFQIEAIQRVEKILYVLGEIQYRDSNKVSRYTGFFRVYSVLTERFQQVEQLWAGSELEYSD